MTALATTLCETNVLEILLSPEVNRSLGGWAGGELHVSRLSQKVFQVSGSSGDFIIRFPNGEMERSRLKREENVVKGVKGHVSLLIPDTRVLEIEGFPAFAVHPIIPGKPLTSEIYESLSAEAHNRLIMDLANFFYETHSTSLATACEWLGFQEDKEELTATYGKPGWFGGEASVAIRTGLATILNTQEMKLFDEVVNLFEALPLEPGYMVFGHGDLHGYNMAIGEDALGPKLLGVFDLGCTGILDIHEDFFRLSLVSEDLLERVIEKYQDLTNQRRTLRRERIAIYYRAFLFYLMCELQGGDLNHLKKMLQRHMERKQLV